MNKEKVSFYSLNFQDLELLFLENSFNPKSASLLYRHHYKEKMTTPCTHHNLSKKVQGFLLEKIDFTLPRIGFAHESSDHTIKFSIILEDDETIESVLIPFQNKYTLCVSTQVGCAMKCSFCYTGTQGLKRNLDTSEIIGQFILAWNWIKENKPNSSQIKNIVYMGQGEPLHNFETIKKANEIFLDQHGMSLGIQKITVSTAGFLPGLKRWNSEMPGVNLALSLHSVFEDKRNELIPINQRYPLSEVMAYIDTIPLARKQYIIYEYLLIRDFNDSDHDAHSLASFLTGREAIINLIPFNPFPGSKYLRPSNERVEEFQKIITGYKLPALVRTTKGDDILAACGQLNTKSKIF